jgi:hypothetical protein
MPVSLPPARARLERLPPHAWVVTAIVLLTIVYAAIETTKVRPYLWPAGAGATTTIDPAAPPLLARPPDVTRQGGRPQTITSVADGSPAAAAGLVAGTRVRSVRRDDDQAIDLDGATGDERALAVWQRLYWLGVSGPVIWNVGTADGSAHDVTLRRPAVWESDARGWSRVHLSTVVQVLMFTCAAVVLLLLRGHDLTAGLAVLALALGAAGSGGPLFGAELALPFGRILTVFGWVARPLAFPVIGLAILYFPRKSPLLRRYGWLHALPFAVAAPMIALSLGTALYLSGLDAARPIALWDALHPGVYFKSFAAALGFNLLAVGEGVHRYRANRDANERRRVRMAVYTGVPGVAAFALKDAFPILASVAGLSAPHYPPAVLIFLQTLILLPAFGLVYAIGVARVLGPRIVLRRSLRYALANRTVTVITALPALALVASLVKHRREPIGDLATSSAALYAILVGAAVAARKYRERARHWLDLRFFREEYDAQKILQSLSSRVRFETDPADLANMVVNQIDEALHPEMVAILVSGIDEGRLSPVVVLHGSAESLPLEGGLAAMLRWSDEPLEIFMQDPRSPALRLPPDEQNWLQCTAASLLVPVTARNGGPADGQDRTLLAVIVLGERRSEEAYSDEDRQLLASIATQMGLGFDVARLRRRAEARPDAEPETTTRLVASIPSPMMECPECGRCEETETRTCPSDGTAMLPVLSVPRTVENKYRIEHLLGRGGMGAVYRARDVRLDRLVALKVVRAELLGDFEARQRFRREAQIVARLQHPSIVAVFDYGTFVDGGAYLVMELVRGEDLRRVLQREGRLDSRRAMRILEAVCLAIEAAHREGVLHRDLKPENILLPGTGAEAKVLDFGVAKVIHQDGRGDRQEPDPATLLTTAGMIVGTPAYMAPEQFQAAQPDARTDIFSLGVIAYEMLSGELPFGRGSLAEIVLAQARGPAPMPPGVAPPAVERAIRSALDADPDKRPSSAQAFAQLVGSAMVM